jgi:hypothetical protein
LRRYTVAGNDNCTGAGAVANCTHVVMGLSLEPNSEYMVWRCRLTVSNPVLKLMRAYGVCNQGLKL